MNQDEKLLQMSEQEQILQFFVCGHLPGNLKNVSAAFGALALDTIRKLLESKDAAVRAALAK
jgi:hypothetical protein